jgi:ABC-type branched-subunit amino acid transport system substrate-binding protein
MPRKLQRRDVLKGVGAAGAVSLAGCVGGLGGGGGGRTVQHGVLLPTSGDLASVGVPINNGAILPLKQLEDADTEFTFEWQEEDTQTDPAAGISAAEALVNAGIPSVTGPASSGVNLRVAPEVFIPNQVVGCSPSSTSPNVTTLDDDDYIFRTPPSDALQGKVLAQVATENAGASTASTMFVNNDYGQALSDSFEGAFSGEVLQTVAFEKQQSSYTSPLSQALGDDPDTLIIIGYPESGIQIFRDYYSDFDTGAAILVTDGLKDPALPSEVGSDMSNVQGTAPSAAGPGVDFFNSSFEEAYGETPGVFTSQAYDASAVCVLANVAGGENTGTAVRDNMRNVANPGGEEFGPSELADAVEAVAAGDDINYVGASSPVDFDDNGDMQTVTYEIFAFTSDGVETETTIEFGG